MITPKSITTQSNCSRGCLKCNDATSSKINVDVSKNNPFYIGLYHFFSNNTLVFNKEVTFLYYGDFSKNNEIVRQGIQNLFDFLIIPTNSNIGVWTKAGVPISQSALDYIKYWEKPGELRVKFSLNFGDSLLKQSTSLRVFFNTLKELKPFLNPKISILLQLNNIENNSLSLKEKSQVFELLKVFKLNFPFLNINFSNHIVKLDFHSDFKEDFFTFKKYSNCIYTHQEQIQFPIQNNFISESNLFIEHVDIFEDAISIHNSDCKKISINNFGSIYDDVKEINFKLRHFFKNIQYIEKLKEAGLDSSDICSLCKKTFKRT